MIRTVCSLRVLAGTVLLTASVVANVVAQGGNGQGGSQAAPIPLSGRSAQGSVVTNEAPVPGATTSVNTLNPAVEVQETLLVIHKDNLRLLRTFGHVRGIAYRQRQPPGFSG